MSAFFFLFFSPALRPAVAHRLLFDRSQPQPTTLAERIARLNAGKPSPSSPPTSSAPISTGAKTKISEKVSKYNTDEAPLRVHGSFGLGGAPRAFPPGGSAEKPRVASLGSGRASVPLNVVKAPRSVSSGGARSRTGSDAASDVGSIASLGDAGSARSGEPSSPVATRRTSPPSSSSSSPAPPMKRTSTFDRVREEIGVSGPGPESVSSVRVETGSIASDVGVDPASIQTNSSTINSPLSSPIAEATIVTDSPPVLELNSSNGVGPRSSSLPHPAGPVAALLNVGGGPNRSDSHTSLSSMVVQDGSVSSDDGADATGRETPTRDPVPTMIGSINDGAVTPDVAQRETDTEREARTKEALKKYEQETEDAPAPLTFASDNLPEPEKVERGPSPVLSTFPPLDLPSTPVTATHSEADGVVAEADPTLPRSSTHPSINEPANGHEAREEHEEGGYGDYLDDFTKEPETEHAPNGTNGAPAVEEEKEVLADEASMPMVKCSDCHAQISLLDLADHTCSSSASTPALSNPPSTNVSPNPPPVETFPTDPSLPPVRRERPVSIPDVPQDDVLDDILDDSPPPSAKGTGLARGSSTQSSKSARSGQHLDAYVQHTDSLVPEDEDDFEDRFASKTSPDLDIPEDMPDSPTDPQPRKTTKPISTHSPHSSTDSQTRYLPKGVPGLDDSDIEEGYEGGSATIVRSVASHR